MEMQYIDLRASQVALVVTHLPIREMQETPVWSVGQEDPLEEQMATHSSILLPRKFYGQRSLVSWGHKELGTTEQLNAVYRSYDKSTTFSSTYTFKQFFYLKFKKWKLLIHEDFKM